MKKNILVIGDYRDLFDYKLFLKLPEKFNICAAIVYSYEDKKRLLSCGIDEVKTLEEIRELNFLDNFSFDLIQEYRSIQRDIEFGMARCLESNMLIANKYYNALFYFIKIFETYKIDCIFSTKMPHGFLEETIPLDIGRIKKIPSYYLQYITASYSAIARFDNKKSLKISQQSIETVVLKHLHDKSKSSHNKNIINSCLQEKNIIKTFFKKIIYKIGGTFLLRVIYVLLHRKKYVDVGFYYKHHIFDECFSLFKFRQMKKYYTKHSIKPDYTQKYVFYAIHFEPEASTAIVCDLQNQLTVIQLLSNSLPEGWYLYIKEHPHQYDLNNPLDYYFIPYIQFFKNVDFYGESLKFSNVRIIDYNTNSKDLIEKSQAVATINGSIIIETIGPNKPCITFDNGIMPITQSNLFPNIKIFENIQDLKEFLNNLSSIEVLSNEEKSKRLKLLSQYYFDHFDKNIQEKIIQILYDDLYREEKK